jgi:hypothetical protein
MTDDGRRVGAAGGHFRVASANIVNETFEDETVVVNLEAGSYYSLTRLASVVWVSLADRSIDQLAEQLVERYDGDPVAIGAAVAAFVAALEQEGLIVPTTERGDAGRMVPSLPPLPPLPDTYEPPTFEKFDDMQDLLLLDPIHDVDESGWPIRR